MNIHDTFSILISSCQEAKVHNNFRSKVGAINVSYSNEKKALVVIVNDYAHTLTHILHIHTCTCTE